MVEHPVGVINVAERSDAGGIHTAAAGRAQPPEPAAIKLSKIIV